MKKKKANSGGEIVTIKRHSKSHGKEMSYRVKSPIWNSGSCFFVEERALTPTNTKYEVIEARFYSSLGICQEPQKSVLLLGLSLFWRSFVPNFLEEGQKQVHFLVLQCDLTIFGKHFKVQKKHNFCSEGFVQRASLLLSKEFLLQLDLNHCSVNHFKKGNFGDLQGIPTS